MDFGKDCVNEIARAKGLGLAFITSEPTRIRNTNN